MWRKNCIHLHGIHFSVKEMTNVLYWPKNRASNERYTKRCKETSCDNYIAIGQETHICIYEHKWSISFYRAIFMKITPVQEHSTEKLYAEFDQNWARNIENRSKYLCTHMSEVQLSMNRFWPTSQVQDRCMEKSYTEWVKSGKKHMQISVYTWEKYSIQFTHCNENHSKFEEYYMDKLYTQS
jgi:hypothetical protein